VYVVVIILALITMFRAVLCRAVSYLLSVRVDIVKLSGFIAVPDQ
jgi:hypothetical protein